MVKFRDAPLSEMDSQRALLDSLMGINRNRDREEDEVRSYRDERVCKFFLLGLCPHDLFGNTKMDLGQCEKVHSDDLKYDFERNPVEKSQYEAMLERELSSYITEADRKIKRARERLEDDKDKAALDPVEANPYVIRISGDIIKHINEAESSAEDGDIDKAQLLMERVDGLQQERNALMARLQNEKNSATGGGVDVNDKLRVCDCCGAFLSIFDSDRRLADHFLGKLHEGYMLMREKLEEIAANRTAERENRKNADDSRRADSHSRRRSSSPDRGSTRRHHRSRTRSRSRERHRDRDRDKGNGGRRRGESDRNRDDRRESSHREREYSRSDRKESDRDRNGERENASREEERVDRNRSTKIEENTASGGGKDEGGVSSAIERRRERQRLREAEDRAVNSTKDSARGGRDRSRDEGHKRRDSDRDRDRDRDRSRSKDRKKKRSRRSSSRS